MADAHAVGQIGLRGASSLADRHEKSTRLPILLLSQMLVKSERSETRLEAFRHKCRSSQRFMFIGRHGEGCLRGSVFHSSRRLPAGLPSYAMLLPRLLLSQYVYRFDEADQHDSLATSHLSTSI